MLVSNQLLTLAFLGAVLSCRPDVALQLGWAIAREVFEQKVLLKEDKYQLKA